MVNCGLEKQKPLTTISWRIERTNERKTDANGRRSTIVCDSSSGSINREIRAGWIISGLGAAFMAFDAAGKFAKPKQVTEAFERIGWPIQLSSTLGAILLACTALYLIPQTSVLGAILLSGYLGGAVATNLRLQNPLLTHTLFPVYFGVLGWIGLWLREPKLQSMFPLLR
jgi:DoxX-like family